MADSFTEITSESWLGRLGNAFKGVLFGLLLIVGAGALLFWNEGRAVKTAKGLTEGASSVVNISADKVDPANEGKLVHVTAKAETAEKLTDPEFGVCAVALRLVRHVETFQWTEKKESHSHDKLGGGRETVTTFRYSTDWSAKLIDSSGFHDSSGHENPRSVAFTGARFFAKQVTLGAFTPTPDQMRKVVGDQKIPVDEALLKTLPAKLQSTAKAASGYLFIGPDPNQPRVGDQRVSFLALSPRVISIIAAQHGNSFEPYATQAGTTLDMVESNDVSAQAMFKNAQDANAMMTWILRLVGFILEWIGIAMLFGPFEAFASVIPLLGDILGAGIGFFSFILALVISLLVIAVAWIAYRPMLGGLLIAGVVGLIVLAKQRSGPAASGSAPR